MEDTKRLLEFGVTKNEAKLLKFFIESRNSIQKGEGWRFKDIELNFNTNRHFYRELLNNLERKGFLTVNKDSKSHVYYFNPERLSEIIKEKRKDYINKRNKLEKHLKTIKSKLTKNFDLKILNEFLLEIKTDLKLSDKQLYLIQSLFEQEDGRVFPKLMTLKQISQKSGNNNIRYNLNLLLKRNFLDVKKIGRTNYYVPHKLVSIIKNEIEHQNKIWKEKERRLKNAVVHFSIEPDIEYKLINLGRNINSQLKQLINQARKEFLIDFRGNIDRINEIYMILDKFFEDLIDIIEKRKIKVKLLFRSNPWIVNKIDKTITKLIDLCSGENLEFRDPFGNTERNIYFIIDDFLGFQIIGDQTASKNYKSLLIYNKQRIQELIHSFNEIWSRSIDFRHVILDYPIKKELQKVNDESLTKKPLVYNFGSQPFSITGVNTPIRIMMNYLNTAIRKIEAVASFFKEDSSGHLDLMDNIYQVPLMERYFRVLYKKIKKGVSVNIIRNAFLKKRITTLNEQFITIIISLIESSQKFKIRETQIPHANFVIIDNKFLILHEYTESKQLKLTILSNNSLIKKFQILFQNAWNQALDIRLSWLRVKNPKIKKIINKSINRVELQIPLPKKGEIRKYDGFYLRKLIKYLLNITRNQIYIYVTSTTKFSQLRSASSSIKDLANIMISYSWEIINASKKSNIQTKVIASYEPNSIKSVTYNDILKSLELFPRYSIRFLPKKNQSDLIFGIYDNYLTFIIGDMTSGFFQVVIVNDLNLKEHYLKRFNDSWKIAVDSRQIFYNYCVGRKKKILAESLRKCKPDKLYSSNEIQEMFPKR
ncbi:MAG: hypothetical protein ACTSRG_13590 [Candidatus Helarchaeota archaeon]